MEIRTREQFDRAAFLLLDRGDRLWFERIANTNAGEKDEEKDKEKD